MAKHSSIQIGLLSMVLTLTACSGGGGSQKQRQSPQSKQQSKNNEINNKDRVAKDNAAKNPMQKIAQADAEALVTQQVGSGQVQVTVGGSMTSAEFNKKQNKQATESSSDKNNTQNTAQAGQQQNGSQIQIVQGRSNKTTSASAQNDFNVQIKYSTDLNEKDQTTAAVQKLYEKLDVDGAYRAIPVVDSIYETTHVPTEKSPYVTVSLYKAVVDSGACDINSAGACLVVESDNRNGAAKQRAYFIATSPESPRSKLIRVVRRNLDLSRGLEGYAQKIMAGTKNQISIFSQVGSLEESQTLKKETYSDDSNLSDSEKEVTAAEMDRVTDEIVSVMDESTQAEVAARTSKNSRRGQALAGSCFLGADLKVIRRFIGVMLPKSYIDDAGQKRYKPTKKGKGRLYCYLPDGTRQSPRIEVQVVDRFVALGWRLSKGTEKFGATGIGWAVNGAQDIIAIGSYRYLVSVDSSISNFFWNQLPGLWKSIGFFVRGSITPIIIGGKKGNGGVLATAAGIGLNKNIWSEAVVSLFGEITINYDPDDL